MTDKIIFELGHAPLLNNKELKELAYSLRHTGFDTAVITYDHALDNSPLGHLPMTTVQYYCTDWWQRELIAWAKVRKERYSYLLLKK